MVQNVAENNKRVAKNTIVLYFRMIFMMLIGLYTSRVNLHSLGVEDYGIYNVVGGIVVMFSVINGSISAAISRFLTFELGTGNIERLKKIFSTSVTIQIIISLIILVLAETIGLWFVNNKMVIPESRMYAANWVYQFSVFTFILNLICMPYSACVVAHERMSAFAWISIYDAVTKLAVALLTFIAPIDKLIFFSGIIVVFVLIQRMIYNWYCHRNFEECHYSFVFDKSLLKQMFGFAGWNFIGATSAILRDTGGNIVINLFCGPAVNAARGIANAVNNAVLGFANSFTMALNPQITKSYASGDRENMMRIVYKGARFSFYLILVLGLPVLMETDYVLRIWLKIVPEHTVWFIRLTIIFAMSEAISNPLITAMLATGRIRNYQIVVGGIQMLNLPISYICLRMGCAPEAVMIVAIILSQMCFLSRIYMLRPLIGLSMRSYFKNVYLNIIFVSCVSVVLPLFAVSSMSECFLRFVIVALVSLISACISVIYIGCTKGERTFILSKVSAMKKRILK